MIYTPHALLHHARFWLDTPFSHQGRSEYGVDCLGLLMVLAKACHLTDKRGRSLLIHDRLDYSKQPDTDFLLHQLGKALYEQQGEPQLADIGIFIIDNQPQHLALFGQYDNTHLSLIHAYAPAHKVVEHAYDANWHERLFTFYRLPQFTFS